MKVALEAMTGWLQTTGQKRVQGLKARFGAFGARTHVRRRCAGASAEWAKETSRFRLS